MAQIIPMPGLASPPAAGVQASPQPPAAARGASSSAPRLRPLRGDNLLKYQPPNERRHRRIVAFVSGLAAVLFFGCAIYGVVHRCNIVPLPVGSHLLIELAMLTWPNAFPISVLHNLVLGGIGTAFCIACTAGHVGLPCDPRRPEIVVWRRQARFALPHWIACALLATGSVALHFGGHPIFAACLESPAFALGLSGCARAWIPVCRRFFVVETDWLREGLGNKLIIGGGLWGFRYGTLVILHHDLISVAKCAYPWEWAVGLASLRIRFRLKDGREATIVIRVLGSAELVQRIEVFIAGTLTTARHNLPTNTPFRPGPHPPGP